MTPKHAPTRGPTYPYPRVPTVTPTASPTNIPTYHPTGGPTVMPRGAATPGPTYNPYPSHRRLRTKQDAERENKHMLDDSH